MAKPLLKLTTSTEYSHRTAEPEQMAGILTHLEREGWTLVSIHSITGSTQHIAYIRRQVDTPPA